ncbi:GeoRSP system SPASM domain protein [Geobacter sp.]|uniref:GeoRSP system SPASM domain protein n=1 Tax=Geobacter sp. TaxID=46610 RepID=UPI002631EC03|nr:GeoRSP system SPASM domain protein [Geobacter sp.]
MELATPITIYWDLPAPPGDSAFLRRVAADIAACRPLMLQVTAGNHPVDGVLPELLEQLGGKGIAVTLTIPAAVFEGALPLPIGVKEVLLAVERLDDIRGQENSLTGSTGMAVAVCAGNWRKLPAIVAYCRERGIRRLVLPMQRLYGGEPPFFLTGEEQRELAAALAAAGGVAGMELTIHDPFLWRAFNPGVPFPQGGCQAANTMIAIAPDGGVYPCPTLPLRLGEIGSASLREIVASAAKREVRRRLLEAPAACEECGELAECRGGCRGRAYVMQGSLEGADPACRQGVSSPAGFDKSSHRYAQ